jgi:hypothetical protein
MAAPRNETDNSLHPARVADSECEWKDGYREPGRAGALTRGAATSALDTTGLLMEGAKGLLEPEEILESCRPFVPCNLC